MADGNDRAARRDMSLASLLAGAAFTNADVGAVHCISEVVGGLYDLAHGLVCALYLPAVTEYSLSAAPERYAAVAAALGVDTAGLPAAGGAGAVTACAASAAPWHAAAVTGRRARRGPRRYRGALRGDDPRLRRPAAADRRPTSSRCCAQLDRTDRTGAQATGPPVRRRSRTRRAS